MRILTVVDYDEMWPALFESERTLLQMTLGKVISRIHHIGSTSVPGLSAKPVIDILIEVANLEELDSLNQAMEGVGYTVRGENGILNRRYFTKGGNQRSHHIHAFATGDAQIIKHLAFRDYLIKHNDRIRDLATCNWFGDGLFRCFYCKRYYFKTYPMETDAGHGFRLRIFSGSHAFHRLDVRQEFQSPDRKRRPLDRFCYSCLSRRQNDFRIFQGRRMLPAI